MVNPPLYSPINPHFFQPLLPGFTNHLDIPVAFFLNYIVGSHKGKTVELRSDASETNWKVKIDGRRLSNGWEDFAIAHDLRIGDIVVFRHEGELVFHVSPLGPSCCEIQYGEDNLEDDKIEKLCDTKNVSRKEKRLKREADCSQDYSCFVATVTASNLRRDIMYLPKEFAVSNGLIKKLQIVLMNEEGESWTLDLRHEAYNGRCYIRGGWRSFCVANGKKPGDLFTFKLVRNEKTHVLHLLPNLNSEDLDKLGSTIVTDNVPRKKSRKIEVDSSPDPPCFVASVTAANLRRDRLYLPKTFVISNGLMKKSQIVLMNEKGESWTIDMKHEPYSGRFLTIRGWRNFCVDNGKKPGDLFTLKLVQNEETPVLQLLLLNSEDLHKPESSNDTRQGIFLEAVKREFLGVEATDKEFLGVETNRSYTRQGKCFKASEKEYLASAKPSNDDIRQGKCSKAIKEEYGSTSRNRFVTLTLRPTHFKTFRLNLPLEFTKANGINKAGMITMLDRYGAKWSTSLLMDKNKTGTMTLGRGSKGFCEVNGVKMNESFVLELIWEDSVPILKFCSKV
ncbi:B3 domain-containing protein REM10 [Cardamine amara subsp. amara]|uniref:B3 domain-containing protein REM10 n=1 Tax=Cardamine amara subsp. amara TaxID=228776 RepID=A0ABD1BW80_CARAN